MSSEGKRTEVCQRNTSVKEEPSRCCCSDSARQPVATEKMTCLQTEGLRRSQTLLHCSMAKKKQKNTAILNHSLWALFHFVCAHFTWILKITSGNKTSFICEHIYSRPLLTSLHNSCGFSGSAPRSALGRFACSGSLQIVFLIEPADRHDNSGLCSANLLLHQQKLITSSNSFSKASSQWEQFPHRGPSSLIWHEWGQIGHKELVQCIRYTPDYTGAVGRYFTFSKRRPPPSASSACLCGSLPIYASLTLEYFPLWLPLYVTVALCASLGMWWGQQRWTATTKKN